MFPDEDLFDLLDDLTNRKITGHDAIAAVNSFTNMYEEYEDLIHSIIDNTCSFNSIFDFI